MGGAAGPAAGAAGVSHPHEGQPAVAAWHQAGEPAVQEPAGAITCDWGAGAGDVPGGPSADGPHQEAAPGLMSAPPSAFSGWEPPSSAADAAADWEDTDLNSKPDPYEEAPAHAHSSLGSGQDMGAPPPAAPWALQGRVSGGFVAVNPSRVSPAWQPPPPLQPAWRPPPQARNLRHYMSGEQSGTQIGHAYSGSWGQGVGQAFSKGPGPPAPLNAAATPGPAAVSGFQQPRTGSWAPSQGYDPPVPGAGSGSGPSFTAEAAQPAMGSPTAPGWPHDAPAWGPQPPAPPQQGFGDPYASGYAETSVAAPPAEPWQAQPWQGMAEPQLTPPMPWQGSVDAPAAPPTSTWQVGAAYAAAGAPQDPALQGRGQGHGGQGGAAAAHSAHFYASAASNAVPHAYTAWSSGPAAEAAAGVVPRATPSWAAEKGAAAQMPGQWAGAASPTPQGSASAAPCSAEEALRNPAGRPPCAAVAWGFGGRVVLLRPGMP